MNDLSPIQLRKRAASGRCLKAYSSAAEAREAGEWFRSVIQGHTVAKYGNEGQNQAGGYLVPIEIVQDAVLAYRDLVGIVRQNARVINMSSDTASVPRRSGTGVVAYFTAENAQGTESQPVFDQIGLSVKKTVALVRASSELEQDAGGFADFMTAELGWALAYLEDNTVINGDATSTFGGINGLKTRSPIGAGQFAGYVDAASGIDTLSEITATDLATALAKIPTAALTNAKWYCSQVAHALVFCRLASNAGGIGTAPNGNPTFWGLEIVRSNLFPSVTTDLSDTPMIYVGDMSQAVVLGSRRGLTIRRSTSRYLEYDQTLWAAKSRWDVAIDVGDASAANGLIALVGE